MRGCGCRRLARLVARHRRRGPFPEGPAGRTKALAVGISALLLAEGAFYFCIQVTQMTPETGVEWVDSGRGVLADTVIPRTPGWKGGLRPGDRLRAVNDRAIASAADAED